MLADLGADVVSIEPTGGSSARFSAPSDDGVSFMWGTFAANKRSIECDINNREARERLLQLVECADVFIESAGVGELARWDLEWDTLKAVNPKLVYVSISPFGLEGPKSHWPASDLTVWGSGGPLAYCQDDVGPPVRISVPQTFLHAGADAVAGALLAILSRETSGRGQHVDISAQASLGIATLATVFSAATVDVKDQEILKSPGAVKIDLSGSGAHTRRSKWHVKDGFVEFHLAMGPAAGSFTNNFFEWMCDEGALTDPEIQRWDWTSLPEQIRQGAVTAEKLERARSFVHDFLQTKTKQEVTEAALARKMLAVGIADVSDLAESEHFADRDFFVTLGGDLDQRPQLTMPGPFARCSASAFEYRRPAPLVGEHTDEVYKEWTGSEGGFATSSSNDAEVTSPTPALGSLKVVDLSWVVAGPIIGRALADFGATVVRVESSVKVETARHMAPFYGGHEGIENSALYINCNAGKLGLALDLTKPESRDVIRDLARWADVVIESFTPGQMEKWGLSYETLSVDNPNLIMLSSSLMGNSGRYSKLAGYGNIGAAMSGFQYLVGWPERDPIGPYGPYTDFVAPRFSLATLLAALVERRRGGRGCYIDVSQVECGAWFLSPEIAAYGHTGVVQQRRGNRDSVAVPHGVFPCRASEDAADFVAIAVRDDEEFRRLAKLMGDEQLGVDPRFVTAELRRIYEDDLEAIIGNWTTSMSAVEVETECVSAGIPSHRASKSTDFLGDSQLAFRGHLVRLPHEIHGEVLVEGPRYLLSATPGKVREAAPLIGEDSDYVLSEILAYPTEKIDILKHKGAIS